MLKKQLYLIYLIALFFPICAIGSFLLYNNYTMLYEHHETMLKSDNLRIRSILFEVTTSITNVEDVLAENTDLYQLIGRDYTSWEEARKALKEFTLVEDLYSRYTEIASLTIYTDNPKLHSYGHIQIIDNENKQWYYDLIKKPGYYWSTVKRYNTYGTGYEEELQLIRQINIPGSQYDALIAITISNNYLKNRIDNNQLNVDITVNKDPIFFSTTKAAGKVIEFNDYEKEDYYSYSGTDVYMDKENLLEVSAIKPIKTEDRLYIFSTDPEAFDEIHRIMMIAGLIILISLVVPFIIIDRFTILFTNRVDTLRTEMHRVTGGDYNIIEQFKGNDELVDLFNDLQVMIHSIKERDQMIYEGRIKEQQLISHQKQIEMELLSSKINPHFLYNTLETIRMKALVSNNREVAQAVKLLGRYMRYNLESTGELTSLASEMEYINIYLSIQKLRFDERIDYDIEIDETIFPDKILILPLLIQPIVENALAHGHEETLEGGKIGIHLIDKGEIIRVEVKDNGRGMTEDELDYVKKEINNEKRIEKDSFGLYNIQQRLKLYYGENSGIEIESVTGEGTCIYFEIPNPEWENSQ